MTLTQLLVFGLVAWVGGWLLPLRARPWLLMVTSVLAIYWLQPVTPIRYLDFLLPTGSLALVVSVWALTQPAPLPGAPPVDRRAMWLTVGVLALLVLLVGLPRYLGPICCITPGRPPKLYQVGAAAILVAGLAMALRRWPAGRRTWGVVVGLLLGLFIVLKSEPVGTAVSAVVRAAAGQSPDLAQATDLRWLGYSYLAFRLIHVVRDRMLNRLPQVTLREFVSYALFFPAFTAGPIDRVERFVKDDRAPFRLEGVTIWEGGSRIAAGVLKKFVLADSLALVALNTINAGQTRSPLWTWVLLYAYAWRLYLDFSGYTDIALGLGRLVGIRLPENFDRPYTRQNLTLFWNSWHMTLAQWFRTYLFNPLTRTLRARPLPPAIIILVTQVVVMGLIGLWHGVTWNFLIWGVWHGLGLFIHNRWASYTKPRAAALDGRPRLKLAAHWLGVGLTFHYVALGWVWFVLPTPELALRVLRQLVGLS